jgi:hypothetical protein
LTEISEHEISLLKETFRQTVQESILYIQPLTLYTSGYLRAELQDDDIIGPRWGTITETRLNLVRLQSDFFETVKKFYNAGITLSILQNSPTLQNRLVIRLEDSDWVISLRQFVFVLWQVLIEPYVRQCWAKHNRIYFDPEIFEDVFAETLKDISASCVETETHLTPIANLKLLNGSVEIAPDIRLRQIAPTEVEQWLNHWHYHLNERPSLSDFLRAQCVIEITYCHPAGYYSLENLVNRINSFNEDIQKIMRVIGLLRLVTDRLTRPLFTQKVRRGFLERNQEISFPQIPKPSGLDVQHFAIDDNIKSELVTTWRKIEQSSVASDADLPFRRWFSAADRISDDDRLIDYWIGLESLFSPDSSQEVKFRASLRIAAYLGNSAAEREQIYRDMRHSYDWRSAVVHGASSNNQKKLAKRGTLQVVTAKTRTYLRMALLKLLRSSEPLQIGPPESEIELLRRFVDVQPE